MQDSTAITNATAVVLRLTTHMQTQTHTGFSVCICLLFHILRILSSKYIHQLRSSVCLKDRGYFNMPYTKTGHVRYIYTIDTYENVQKLDYELDYELDFFRGCL